MLGVLLLRQDLPDQAIEVRGYADFVPMGAMVTPLRSDGFDHVDPPVPQRDQAEAVQVPDSHRREEGKAQPFDHYPTGDDDLKSPTLMCEPAGLNTEKGPVKMDKVPTL